MSRWRKGHRPPTEEERERRLLEEQAKRERERQDRMTTRHISSVASRVIQRTEQAKRKRATDEAAEYLQQMNREAMAQEASALAASAPKGANDGEWVQARKVLMQVQDLQSQTGSVGFGVTDTGKKVAVLAPKVQNSEGLFRRYVADVGELAGKPVDTTKVARVKESK